MYKHFVVAGQFLNASRVFSTDFHKKLKENVGTAPWQKTAGKDPSLPPPRPAFTWFLSITSTLQTHSPLNSMLLKRMKAGIHKEISNVIPGSGPLCLTRCLSRLFLPFESTPTHGAKQQNLYETEMHRPDLHF